VPHCDCSGDDIGAQAFKSHRLAALNLGLLDKLDLCLPTSQNFNHLLAGASFDRHREFSNRASAGKPPRSIECDNSVEYRMFVDVMWHDCSKPSSE